MTETKGEKEKDRKRKPVTEQMEAAEMAERVRAKQTKMQRSSGAYDTVVSALVEYC